MEESRTSPPSCILIIKRTVCRKRLILCWIANSKCWNFVANKDTSTLAVKLWVFLFSLRRQFSEENRRT